MSFSNTIGCKIVILECRSTKLQGSHFFFSPINSSTIEQMAKPRGVNDAVWFSPDLCTYTL